MIGPAASAEDGERGEAIPEVPAKGTEFARIAGIEFLGLVEFCMAQS